MAAGPASMTKPAPSAPGEYAASGPCIVRALEQPYQAPMVAMPGAADCLGKLKSAGFGIAVCSN
jgi:phosphoglycolate phosphatase-like HAD superfamily hydrolase